MTISYKLLKCYSNVFKKYSNNTESVCLNVILQTLDMFLHIRLTELRMFCMTFFSSTVFVISRLVCFLIKRQASEAVL